MIRCAPLMFLTFLYSVECANILFVTSIPSHSHQVVFQPIWKELSLRGHNVTALALTPLNDKSLTNLTEIDLSFIFQKQKEISKQYKGFAFLKFNFLIMFLKEILATRYIIEAQEDILKHPDVSDLIKSDYKFDVVIAEWIFPFQGAFAARFNCPLVGITSLGAPVTLLDTVGNPSHPVYAPDQNLPMGRDLSLYDRVFSTLYAAFARSVYYWFGAPQIDASVKKFFGKDMPYIDDIARNISVLLLNRNPVLHRIMSVVPAAVELGGVRSFKKVEPLNTELQDFLDKSKNGVVYFSLGSNVPTSNLPDEVRNIFLKVFEQLPYNVVWKWEEDVLPGKPKNVFVQKWISQASLLAHPNVKLFITHGGLQSMEETINNHVPIVGIPLQFDQPMNVDTAVKNGFGIRIEYDELTIDGLKSAIYEIMNNHQSYKDNIAKIEKIMNDLPMEGLDKAIWWIEYVIRHKGARHLRSPSLDLPWYQFYLLDVIALVLLLIIVSMYVSFKTLKIVIWTGKMIITHRKKKQD